MATAASDAYNRISVNRSQVENQHLIEKPERARLESGHTFFGRVATSFG
jgi:hypothetical protein